MANNFLTPNIIANEALMVLQSNLVMALPSHQESDDAAKMPEMHNTRSNDNAIAFLNLFILAPFWMISD